MRWLAGGVAALLLTLAPLCGVACSAGVVASSSPAQTASASEGHCHETPAVPAPAPEVPDEHAACACSGALSIPSTLAAVDLPPSGERIAVVDGVHTAALRWVHKEQRAADDRRAAGLPPPDILLLKTTLLI